jgi:hypothetical protein
MNGNVKRRLRGIYLALLLGFGIYATANGDGVLLALGGAAIGMYVSVTNCGDAAKE